MFILFINVKNWNLSRIALRQKINYHNVKGFNICDNYQRVLYLLKFHQLISQSKL